MTDALDFCLGLSFKDQVHRLRPVTVYAAYKVSQVLYDKVETG